MNYLKLKQKIYEAIERNPLDRSAYEEMFAVCREYEKIDFQTAHAWNHELRNHISRGLRMTVSCQKFDEAREFDDLMFRSLLFGAQHFFDDYLQAVEYGKPLDKKFYQPRRHYLRRYVDAYQEILDGKLDFLSISMPKRAGKSQLGINFTNMLSGKYPDRATLMEGTGDDLVKSFYLGCLEYLTLPSDYHFYDIFPESKLVQTNADTKIINLLHKSRFPTVMCRSIDARQVGLSEATNLLYLDDCVEGREEAKNRQRLDDKWEVISGDIIGRAIEGTPIVICGTRYSLYDPIGHLQEEMQKQGKRCKIIETPALDPVTDESNFEYMREGRKVFTTQYFRDQREMLSEEQFESEFQQQPFEAKGILFPEKSLNRYFELPIDRDPDSIIAVCDTADTGDDFCAMPIAAVYGSEVYIVDAINLTDSNRLDGVEQFIQALMLFHNVDISSEDFDELRERGAIKFKDIDPQLKAEINYLVSNLNQGETQTLVDHMYQTVLTICGMPNRNGGSSTSDTGSAVIMRDGWSAAEARAKDSELMFKKSERIFLKVVLNICRTLANMDLKVCNVEIRFTRRNYENILQKAQVLDLMLKNNKIHPRLAFEHCGLFVDSDLAYTLSAEYAEEQEQKAQELFEQQQRMKQEGNDDDSGNNEGNGGADGKSAETREQSGNTD